MGCVDVRIQWNLRFGKRVLELIVPLLCPESSIDDFRRANTIYGPMVEVLKGKGTRDKPQHIPSTVKMVLPPYILTEHRDVTLTADFLEVNGNFFLHTKSRKLHFRTVVPVQDRTKCQKEG